MRRIFLVALCFGLTSSPPATGVAAGDAVSQVTVENCYGCVLGIWDDFELTNTAGSVAAAVPRDIFVGIKFDPAAGFDRLTGIDCRISGFEGMIVGDFGPPLPGSGPPAPTPTDSLGVWNLSYTWGTCLHGSQALAKLTLITFSQISDRILQVVARPPRQYPVIFLCDAPVFTAVNVTGGRYCLNPGPTCREAVEERAWSSVKQLFR